MSPIKAMHKIETMSSSGFIVRNPYSSNIILVVSLRGLGSCHAPEFMRE